MTDRDTHSLFEQAKALLTEKSDILSCVRGISLLKQAAGRGDTACWETSIGAAAERRWKRICIRAFSAIEGHGSSFAGKKTSPIRHP